MVGRFFSGLMHLFFRIVIFVLLVWIFLGITPVETYKTATDRVASGWHAVLSYFGYVQETASDMKDAANSQLQQASDRFHGKDPYERLVHKLDADVAAQTRGTDKQD